MSENTQQKIYGLIGYPLSHSFSKNYFAEKFEKENINDSYYDNFPLSSIDEFPDLIKNQKNLAGLNVTIPYKEKVVPFLDELSEDAKAIGAVNTIKFKDGKLIGYNTDVLGFEESLKGFMSKNGVTSLSALILGTGGAAKAIAYVLTKMGISFSYISRHKRENTITYSELKLNHIQDNHLIINTTPLGMYPLSHRCPPISYQQLTSKHLLFDLIYNPENSVFLKMGKAQHCATKNGFEMLVLQAEGSYKIWQRP